MVLGFRILFIRVPYHIWDLKQDSNSKNFTTQIMAHRGLGCRPIWV